MVTMSENISIQLNNQQQNELIQKYQNFAIASKNQYVRFCAKVDAVTINLYTSGKVVFQGVNANALATPFLNHHIKKDSNPSPKIISTVLPQAGSDEVGTGDVFGPIVVVASYVDETIYEQLQPYNINDSKQLSDDWISEMAPKLMNIVPYASLILDNKKYNDVHQQYNLNALKAILHNSAYAHLQTKIKQLPKLCVVDQFTPENSYYRYLKNQSPIISNLTFQTKAESSFISVAISSMIARYLFLQAMDQLSTQVGFTLHKGAGKQVDEDINRLINEKGKVILPYVAKCHFSNIQKKL